MRYDRGQAFVLCLSQQIKLEIGLRTRMADVVLAVTSFRLERFLSSYLFIIDTDRSKIF